MLLPVQIAMATARTLGTYVHGRPFERRTAGPLFEQSFDLLVVAFLAVASRGHMVLSRRRVAVDFVRCCHDRVALLAVGSSIRLIQWLAASYNAKTAVPRNRILRSFWELQHSGTFNAGLARRLVMLSVGRFIVVVLMSIQTAEAIGVHIPLWQMARHAICRFCICYCVDSGRIWSERVDRGDRAQGFGTPLAIGARGPWPMDPLAASIFLSRYALRSCLAPEESWFPARVMNAGPLSDREREKEPLQNNVSPRDKVRAHELNSPQG